MALHNYEKNFESKCVVKKAVLKCVFIYFEFNHSDMTVWMTGGSLLVRFWMLFWLVFWS